MKAFVKKALLIVNGILFVIVMLFTAIGLYDEIFGGAKTEELFRTLHIPLNYNQYILIYACCTALMLGIFFLRKKLYK